MSIECQGRSDTFLRMVNRYSHTEFTMRASQGEYMVRRLEALCHHAKQLMVSSPAPLLSRFHAVVAVPVE